MTKVLHLCYSDNYGGASVAMNRINESLLLIDNIDSKIAVVVPSNNPSVLCLSTTLFDKIWLYVRVRIAYKLVAFFQKTSNHSGRSINFFSSTVCSRLNKLEFDVLHLHWIGNETIRLEDLVKINKPIVWTFHDKWPLLGAEHTEINDSTRYIEGYSDMNRPLSTKGFDIDRWTWNRKKKMLSTVNIQPVVVSSWLAHETKKSFLWKNSNPAIIHNPIKVNLWELKDKKDCRNFLNISKESKVIVFGAVNAFSDELKGYSKLEEAIFMLSKKLINENFTLIVFGDPVVKEINLSENLVLKSIGKIDNHKLLNQIYCCADVVAVPSFVETFGQVAVEAISCGVPVIAFKTSGLLDIIINDFNGILCKAFDVEDMSEKIINIFSINWDVVNMRKDIEDRFGYLVIAEKYEAFYSEVLK